MLVKGWLMSGVEITGDFIVVGEKWLYLGNKIGSTFQKVRTHPARSVAIGIAKIRRADCTGATYR